MACLGKVKNYSRGFSTQNDKAILYKIILKILGKELGNEVYTVFYSSYCLLGSYNVIFALSCPIKTFLKFCFVYVSGWF